MNRKVIMYGTRREIISLTIIPRKASDDYWYWLEKVVKHQLYCGKMGWVTESISPIPIENSHDQMEQARKGRLPDEMET